MLREEIIVEILKIIGNELASRSDIVDGDSLKRAKEKSTKVLKDIARLWEV